MKQVTIMSHRGKRRFLWTILQFWRDLFDGARGAGLHVLVLAAPGVGVPWRKLDFLLNGTFGVCHVAVDISVANGCVLVCISRSFRERAPVITGPYGSGCAFELRGFARSSSSDRIVSQPLSRP
jgi:hypothetical protein